MFTNFLKIAFRNLRRNLGFSIINISGLAIGMASAILIMLWVQHEFSYDGFHAKADRIYRLHNRDVGNDGVSVWGFTSSLVGPELKQSFSEVEDQARISTVFFLVTNEENKQNIGGAFADPSLLSMFNFTPVDGRPVTFKDDFSIILTESLAKRLFGNEDPIGKAVMVENRDQFTVTGVIKDQPKNTWFEFEFVVPWEYQTRLGWISGARWTWSNTATFVLLKGGASGEAFDEKVRDLIKKQTKDPEVTRELIAQPLGKMHLYTSASNGLLTGGRIEIVRMFSWVALIILLVACTNFMNLSTARSEKRGREVGIRKAVGAARHSLIVQFIGESTLIAAIAFLIGIAMVQISLPVFSDVVGTPLTIEFGNPVYWLVAAGFIVITGVLAGSYPAFFLSSFQPVTVLKGTFMKVKSMLAPRRVLVVLQFTFAITLIICTIFVRRQVQLAEDRDMGWDKKDLVYNFTQGEVLKNYKLIRHDLLESGAAISVSKTFSPIVRMWGTYSDLSWAGSTAEDKKTVFLDFGIDAGFTKTLGAQILEGRDLDIDLYPTDSSSILLNEAAVAIMRLNDPVGAVVRDSFGNEWKVVGVVKDFIVDSPYQNVAPMIVQGWRNRYGCVHFRLNPANTVTENLARAEKVFKKHNPAYPFEFVFAEQSYAKKFGSEKRIGTLSALFGGLSIFISCLGLFGLATYFAELRTKEIGLRKVMGASVAGLVALLSMDFIKLVFVAILVATPLGWWAMDSWLENYSYRVPLSAGVFVTSGILAIGIALVTVSTQAVKAAVANPVKSLRTE
jgi:ABC-type antimicrobial peptide transport system permease subunit